MFDDNYAPIYAVKFSPDRTTFSIAVAQPLASGKIHVEIARHRPMSDGFQAIVKWFMETPPQGTEPRWKKANKIIVDGATGQDILIEDMTSVGIPMKKIVRPNMKEVATAHEFMFTGIKDQTFSHYRQPALDQAVRIAKIRPIGRQGAFGWGSTNPEMTTCALDAATFAFWGARTMAKKILTPEEKAKNSERVRQILSQL